VPLDVAQRVADRGEFAGLDRIVNRSTNGGDRADEPGMSPRHAIEKRVVVLARADPDDASRSTPQAPYKMRGRGSRRAHVGIGMAERIGMLERRSPGNARRIARNDRPRRARKQEHETGDQRLQ